MKIFIKMMSKFILVLFLVLVLFPINAKAYTCSCAIRTGIAFSFGPVGPDVEVPNENSCIQACACRGATYYKNGIFEYSSVNQQCASGPVSLPPTAQSPTNSPYIPLESLPGMQTNGSGSAPIDIASYLPNLVKLAIGLAAALSVIYIIIGGFKYISTDAIFDKKEGKETITNAVWGLLLAISSVVILNTISPKILSVDLNIKPTEVGNITVPGPTGGVYTQPIQVTPGTGNCVCADSVTAGFYGTISQYNVTSGTSCQLACSCDNASYFSFQSPNIYAQVGVSCPARNGGATGSGTGSSWSSDQTDRTAFTNLSSNISFNRDNCQTVGQSGCTSVLDIGPAVISGVGQLARTCNCSVIITGGTEYWLHSANTAHRAGGNVVDLSIGTPVTAYIEKNGQRLPNDTSCSTGVHYKLSGAMYVNEQIDGNAPHWHVCY